MIKSIVRTQINCIQVEPPDAQVTIPPHAPREHMLYKDVALAAFDATSRVLSFTGMMTPCHAAALVNNWFQEQQR